LPVISIDHFQQLIRPMPKPELQKFGTALYSVAWADEYAYMCGGGNLGLENK